MHSLRLMFALRKLVTRRRMSHTAESATTRGGHPARTVVLAFLLLVSLGTLALTLPGMGAQGRPVALADALFTAVSAGCVTGLAVVDTAQYWSPLGQFTIMILIQIGGFGIMTLGTLMVLLITRRVGLQTRLATSTETGTMELGELRRILLGVGVITVVIESTVSLALALRFIFGYGVGVGRGIWLGVFHSVSAFNNAGFALWSDSLTQFRSDIWIMAPISVAIVLGGLGFPVLMELGRRTLAGRLQRGRRNKLTAAEVSERAKTLVGPGRYAQLGNVIDRQGFRGPVLLSLHTRLMLIGTVTLLIVGTFGFALCEWGNASTLGGESFLGRLGQAFFSGGVTPRTAGFNTIDYAQVRPETRFLTDLMMLIGGGSASTAGGVKVTTIMVLLLASATEVRGHRDVNAMDRRIPEKTVRIAISVIIVSAAAVMVGTMALMAMTSLDLDRSLFEVASALATVGLSTGVTPTLPEPAQLLLVVLMFLGGVGPITLVSALALRSAERRYRLPEGRPLIG